MANQDHLNVVYAGTQAILSWRKSNPGCPMDLREAVLSTWDLKDADLRGADLQGAQIRDAYLYGADLRGANLQAAQLFRTNLGMANLQGADLSGANLDTGDLFRVNARSASFRGAKLDGAELALADFTEADFTEASFILTRFHFNKLFKTNFAGAVFGNTSLCALDFSEATGLDSTRHDHPSSLGFDTFWFSKGEFPAKFLQGCGMPQVFISEAKKLAEAVTFYSCFIAHSHADKLFAQRLHDALRRKGIRCWYDEHQLRGGDDILDAVDRGVQRWDKTLLICSETALKESWWVDVEIDKTIQKEQRLHKERGEKVLALIPIDLDGYFLQGWGGGKASLIRGRKAIDFREWGDDAKFRWAVDLVIGALMVGGREEEPESRL